MRARQPTGPVDEREAGGSPAVDAPASVAAIVGLQQSAGNQAVSRLLEGRAAPGPLLQRMTVTTQNKAEVEKLKKRYLAANPGDYGGWDAMVKDALGMPDLKKAVDDAAPEQQQASGNPFGDHDRPGAMSETDAGELAEYYEWDIATASEWTCKDRSHTPKGRVYTDGKGNYWGADNTGHAGFAFKYWTGSPKELTYRGNVPHHDPTAVVQRGAQRTEKKGKKK